jgi:RNA polymerase-binding transcription factor
MKSRKDKKIKSKKMKASVTRKITKTARKAAPKVSKKLASKSKPRTKLKGIPKSKSAAKSKSLSRPKSVPKPKVVSKPKAPAKLKKVTKAKVAAGKIKKIAVLQRKKSVAKPDDFRTAFMKSLELKKLELQQTLDGLMKSRQEYEGQLTAGDFIDEVDDAQREISAYSQFSLIERKNKELQKIEYLLNRVAEEQDFGLCEECGTRIPKERLLLVPEATLCVACQRELEKMDSRTSMASHPTGFSPTRREVSWETTEPPEEDDNLLVEYHISTMPDVDMNEGDTEVPPEDKEDKDA